MDFHAKNRSQDDVLRMPADGSALNYIEEKWPIFKEEPRNVRLLLAVDGLSIWCQSIWRASFYVLSVACFCYK
jgi:hypothetical protein